MSSIETASPTADSTDCPCSDVIAALYRDAEAWDAELSELMPFGPTVVRRSMRRLIDDHVGRLRDHLISAAEEL